jgi:hypothetical protein
MHRDKMGWVSLRWVGLVGGIVHCFHAALSRVRSVWDRLKVHWASLK